MACGTTAPSLVEGWGTMLSENWLKSSRAVPAETLPPPALPAGPVAAEVDQNPARP